MRDSLSELVNAKLTEADRKAIESGRPVKLDLGDELEKRRDYEWSMIFGSAFIMFLGLIIIMIRWLFA